MDGNKIKYKFIEILNGTNIKKKKRKISQQVQRCWSNIVKDNNIICIIIFTL